MGTLYRHSEGIQSHWGSSNMDIVSLRHLSGLHVLDLILRYRIFPVRLLPFCLIPIRLHLVQKYHLAYTFKMHSSDWINRISTGSPLPTPDLPTLSLNASILPTSVVIITTRQQLQVNLERGSLAPTP